MSNFIQVTPFTPVQALEQALIFFTDELFSTWLNGRPFVRICNASFG
ncbi:MAG TPA: hypothetical protein VIX90_14875 [Edaphobacter sp.]